ncbi:MAG: hypothetical protein ABW076_16375 [Candidatus Thiodiazotropha sp.]
MGRNVDLLIPGLAWQTGLAETVHCERRPKSLEWLIGRAKRRQVDNPDFNGMLFEAFGVSAQTGRDLPSGAVISVAHDRNPDDAVCALVTPAHLLTDRDRLLLLRHPPGSLPKKHAQTLIGQLNDHFAADGISLEFLAEQQWLLRLQRLPDITTSAIETVVGRHIEPYLPEGQEARLWRRFLNEAQMLLFHSEVNQQRGAEGQLSVNALWISGVGSLPRVQTALQSVFADYPLARGLAKLAHTPCDPVSRIPTADELPEGRSLVVMTDLLEAEIDVRPDTWLSGLDRVDARLETLIREFCGRDDRIRLCTCDGSCYETRGRAGWLDRFRRNTPLTRLLG